MARVKTISTDIHSLFRLELKGFSELSCDLFNHSQGSMLTAFQIKLYSTEDSPGVIWFRDASEWVDLPEEGVIRAVARGANPATLAPGASTAFRIEEVSAFHSVEFLASANGETTIELYVGRVDK